MKHLFIVNPVAGGQDRTGRVTSEVCRVLAGTGTDYEIYTTTKPMDAYDKIRKEAESSPGRKLRVYACGGDGTLNECVNGAFGFPYVAVTHYPTGTGNDFIKMFGKEKDYFGDLEELIDGYEEKLDVMDCNGRICLNICSVGIDARIGTQVHNYSSLPFVKGSGAYLVSAVANLIKGVGREMNISCGDEEFTGEHSLICACNGQHYGGAFNPMPEAVPNDGILEFLVVKKVSRLTFLRIIGKYATGRYKELSKYITHLRGDSLTITCRENAVINIDGEAIYDKNINIKLVPGGSTFVFPKSLSYFKAQNMNTEVIRRKEELSLGNNVYS